MPLVAGYQVVGARAALITGSICREVSLFVPFRRDSSPMAYLHGKLFISII
jgi:hypothetical protein